MDVLFYPAFTEIGERLILVHRLDVEFSDLPENIRNGFDGIEPQKDEIDPSNLSSRWWLCAEGVKNLYEPGYDRFKFTRG